MAINAHPKPLTYAGLAVVTLATLMHQILLTRIFSVTMFYHFAFMAISIAMFGMTVGAIVVFLRPAYTEQSAPRDLAWNAFAYGVSLPVTFVLSLAVPFVGDASPKSILYLTLTYVLAAVPFTFSGITVSIALTKFSGHVGKLYAADLAGASLGGIALIGTLDATDGPTAVFVVALFAVAGAVAFAHETAPGLFRNAATTAAGLLVFVVWHTSLVRAGAPLVRIGEARGVVQEGNHWERWNSFSRVHVAGNPWVETEPLGWGLSDITGAKQFRVRQLAMGVDVWAATVITQFTGDLSKVAFLRDDVSNIAHHLRPNANVLAVGAGGGRDLLSALVFDQAHVTGVEINENVIDASMGVYGDFSGHLDRHPKVTLVNDEARSYIARSKERFDIIQISLIDTWAATAAGAFVLSENALYTEDGWTVFLDRLTERGMLTVSRWHFPTSPTEVYRSAALARGALERLGVARPADHVAIVKMKISSGLPGALGNGVATVLVARNPLTEDDLETLDRETRRMGFEVIGSPRGTTDAVFEKILASPDPRAFYESFPVDVSPPTDDKPFFFQMVRFRDIANAKSIHPFDPNRTNLESIRLLGALLGITLVLTLGCVFVPLALSKKSPKGPASPSLLAFFVCIGLGFMFIEISQMQRLIVLLGHPTYALTVVLFTLLVGAGIGSFISARMTRGGDRHRSLAALGALLALLVAFGVATPPLVSALASATNEIRIGSAAAMLLLIGVFLGMPFPLGMGVATARTPSLMPWLWGVNGAASVLCTVVATAVAMSWGIAASYWLGVACYAAALGAFSIASRVPNVDRANARDPDAESTPSS